MMDRLMLLAKGKIIYFNEASKAVDYFSSINFTCSELSNPADYFMSIMSVETIEQDLQEKEQGARIDKAKVMEMYQKQIDYFSDNYQKSDLYNDPNSSNNTQVLPISKEEQIRMSKSTSSWCY